MRPVFDQLIHRLEKRCIPDRPRSPPGQVEKAVEQLEQLTAKAELRHMRGSLIAVFRHIIETLETRPRVWGDPVRNYRGLDATGYKPAILPADQRVEHAVHNTDPLVWISKLIVLEDSPFADR